MVKPQLLLAAVLGALLASGFGLAKKSKKSDSIIPSPSFATGREYSFRYDAQIGSGYASWISTQKALSRIQSKITISFKSSSEAVFRMQECRMGQLNAIPAVEPWNPARIQPIDIFESVTGNDQKFNEKLELPVQFSYIDGIVTNIQFHQDEQIWSKNIKKAALNMLQLNTKPTKQDQDANEFRIEQELRKTKNEAVANDDQQSQQKTFTVTEIGVEGECETTYTISASTPSRVNVTKSINFDNCKTLADTVFGTHVDNHVLIAKQQLAQRDRMPGVLFQTALGNNRSAINKQMLDRTTIIRYVLNDGVDSMKTDDKNNKNWQQTQNGNGEQDNCDIHQVELLSNYVLKGMNAESSQAMQTVAVARLQCTGSRDASSSRNNKKNEKFDNSEPESLLYNSDLESREQIFYMLGDESELIKKRMGKAEKGWESPLFPLNYPNSETKAKKIKELLRKVADASTDEFRGGENRPIQMAEEIDELAKILRFCTVEEIKRIQAEVASSEKSQRVLADGLAAAATRNTLKVLTEQIQKGAFDELRATQLLKIFGKGGGILAPSDRIADLMLVLCKDEKIQRMPLLKQACWLAFGSVVNEAQRAKQQAQLVVEGTLRAEMILPHTKIDLYKKVFLEHLKASSNDLYETVVAIKAIGNSGLEGAIEDLKDIIDDQKESPIARINAIEAFRRMNPQKTQRVLLPVFQNQEERPDIRMTAFSVIMDSRRVPPKHIVDQIAYAMSHESSEQVKSFVFTKLRTLSESPIYEDQRCAAHMKAALKLVQIDDVEVERSTQSSTFERTAFYSKQHQEGIFVDVVKMYSTKSSNGQLLPTHSSVSIDKLFNGELEKEALRVSICQNGVEDALKQLMTVNSEEQDKDDEADKKQSNSVFATAAGQLRSIFNKLGISGSGGDEKARNGPSAMIGIRVNDVDTTVIPLGTHAPEQNRASMKALRELFLAATGAKYGKTGFELNGIVGFRQRSARVPTSVGMELKVKRSNLVYGKVNVELSAQGQSQLNVIFTKSVTVSQIQKMKVWATPIHGSGVKRVLTAELKTPLEFSAQSLSGSGNQKTLKLSVRVPQQKMRLLAVHSIPMTFVTETDVRLRDQLNHGERIRAIENQQLEKRHLQYALTVGEESLRLPLKIKASLHKPRHMTALKENAKSVLASENHFVVDFEPIPGESPRELTIQFTADLFNNHANTPSAALRPQLNHLRSKLGEAKKVMKSRLLDDSSLLYSDEQNEDKNIRREAEERNMNSYLDKYTMEKAYKHSLKIEAETVGGSRSKRAELQLEGVCDAKLQTCESRVRAERSPMLQGETGPWTMEGDVKVFYPETVADAEEMNHAIGEKHQKFVCRTEFNWGSQQQKQQRQSIKADFEGEASREMLQRALAPFQDPHKLFQGLAQRQAPMPFINKYTAVVDYRLQPRTQSIFAHALEMVKAANYWNTQTIQQGEEGTQKSLLSADPMIGRVQAQVEIEPSCTGPKQHANITIRTERQLVHIESLELPKKTCPMQLVRNAPIIRPIHSVAQFLSSIGITNSRGECKVDFQNDQVNTFDGAVYPARLSNCYTVLAKDCQPEDSKTPRFAVLMKGLVNGQKLKMITKKRIIEVEPNPAAPRKLLVKVNGQQYSSEEVARDQRENSELIGIEYTTNENGPRGAESVTIDDDEVTVRFNSAKGARIHINGKNKRSTCGLCGDFNDDHRNDHRQPDGRLASKLSSLHRSFTLEDNKEGCTSDSLREFYSQNFDEKYDSSEDKENRMRGQKFGIDNTKLSSRKESSNNSEELRALTAVMDYNHKVCFSLKPIKQCPMGTMAVHDGTEQPKTKVQFACLDRHSVEAKRMKKTVNKNIVVAEIEKYPASFTETVVVPERCIKH